MNIWKHRELVMDLAGHLMADDRMVWPEMRLGPSGSPQADVLTLQKSFVNPRPTIYEVKISMADYRSDATVGKWQKYLQCAEAVYFAVPRGLIQRNQIPEKAGLITRGPAGWHSVKAPIREPLPKPLDPFLLKLLIDGIDRAKMQELQGRGERYLAEERIRKELGKEVADILRDKDRARREIERSREVAKVMLDGAEKQIEARLKRRARDADRLLADVRRDLGLPEGAGWWDIRSRINRLIVATDKDKELERLRGCMKTIREQLDRAEPAEIIES